MATNRPPSGVEAARNVKTSVGATRTELTRALRQERFTIDSEHTTLVEASRGTMIAGSLATVSLPVAVTVRLEPLPSGCAVAYQIENRWRTPLTRVSGLEAAYAELCSALTSHLDAALARLDPDAARDFTQVGAETPAEQASGLLGRAGSSVGSAARSVIDAADRRLQGVRETSPRAWDVVQAVRITIGETEVLIGRIEIDNLVDVAALIGAQPEGLPPPLVQHVERLAAGIEAVLDDGEQVPTVRLVAADQPTLTFLRQQTALREALPVRRLMVCRDCRLEKVVNEDYQRITEKNRRLNELLGRFGPLSPTSVLRQVVRAQLVNVDFVCPRCQGMSADPLIITFCPSCGGQQKAGALKSCACGYDFRADGARRLAERPPVALPPPAPGPVPFAPPAPAAPTATAPTPAPGVADPPPEPASGSAPAPVPTPVDAKAWPTPDALIGRRLPQTGHPTTAQPTPGSPAAPAKPAPAAPIPSAPAGHPAGQLPLPAAGWYADPWRVTAYRYWDGTAWTGYAHPPVAR